MGFTELLEHDKNLDSHQREQMRYIYQAGNHLLDLVNDANVVLLSPVYASHQFSGKRDYFFRVVPSSNVLCKAWIRTGIA